VANTKKQKQLRSICIKGDGEGVNC